LVIETLTHTRIANLNRDDLGEVKRAGDRIRISSQCLKRNIRTTLSDSQSPVRSRQFPQSFVERAVSEGVCTAPEAVKAAIAFFVTKKKGKAKKLITDKIIKANKEDSKKPLNMEYLVLLSHAEREYLYQEYCSVCKGKDVPSTWDMFKFLEEAKQKHLDNIVALFGRMFADSPKLGVEGAAAFKHAYTVQAQDAEKDFFTAVDDITGGSDVEDSESSSNTGSGHLGVSEFASGDFYNCVHLNLDLLATNLGLDSDSEEFKGLVGAFLKAVISSFPKAKHNSNLANNLPYYVRTRIVTGFACTNDDAFAEPLATMDQQAIVDRFKESVAKKDAMYDGLSYNVLGTWEAFNSSVKELVEETVKYVG
jgi:CRISPR system Cascade subunit CasC